MGFRRVAVVMAGGSGTRFWPVSTSDRPKQFLKLASPEATLLEQSVARVAPLVGEDVYVATAGPLVGATRSLLPGMDPSHVFGEPSRRNTLGALVWASAWLKSRFGEGRESLSIAVLTADHAITPEAAFRATVERALSLAEETGSLVTIGITPTRAATEYGYIEVGKPLGEAAWRAARFTEKPDVARADEFVRSGRYFWNSGMFFWTLAAFCDQLRSTAPEAHAAMDEIVARLAIGDEARAAEVFDSVEATSIDYALMERATNVAVVKADFEWDDLGSWDALSRSLPSDESGNVSHGDSRILDSGSCVVYKDSKNQAVTLFGVSDIIVAVTDGQVLVCSKDRAQDVRKLAD